MTKTAIVKKFYTDGRVEEVDEQMNLKELQAFVGGYIEYVPTTIRHRVLIVNENGFNENLPENAAATEVVRPDVMVIGLIRGNALLVKD